jgi:hypothetical protein
MKRSINFGNIFRRKEDQAPPPSDQTDHAALARRLIGRSIKLARGDLEPVSSDLPPLDWDKVEGLVKIPGEAIEGLLEGRARVRAVHLKSLSPSPLGADTPDQVEYVISLPALIPQIQDLLGSVKPELELESEYETPFTILAKQDGARFAGQSKEEPREQLKSDLVPLSPVSVAASKESLSAQEPEDEEEEQNEQDPAPESVNPEPPVLTLRTLRSAPGRQGDRTEPPENALEAEDNTTPQHTIRDNEPEQPGPKKDAADQIKLFKMITEEERVTDETALAQITSQQWNGDTSTAGRGMGTLQEIFMTSEPLDGRRVASLIRQFPGVTGALILLEGGAVLGGQLPESLNMEAALQTPEVLARFLRFIFELEDGSVSPRFVTVTSSNTISLVSSGRIVLLVSHQGRRLPPGLAQRLTETAQALDLIYGKN